MRLWWCLLLLPTVALATTENWPERYNTGVTAYRSNDFAEASQLFENATSSKDRALQQRALYNLGNADFRLGQSQPKQAQQLWERAVKSYEEALAIDPNDPDAKFNHEFVKKKLEELKKQQQQQQQQQQQKQNEKNQQQQNQKQQENQKNQQDKDQSQKQEQQQQNQQQQQAQQQQKQEDKQSERQQQEQSQRSAEQQKQQDEQKKQQQEQADRPDRSSAGEQQPQEASGQPQDMDKMQAAEILDNLRENEQNWNFFPEVQMKNLKDSGPPAKDW
ncbi:MAG TPA: tetratricopeptide repeat protein [Verrucomicrobiae bacterium]|nr:tetratricopeptide repeat protein [Verrucomicrobiae bacterium]